MVVPGYGQCSDGRVASVAAACDDLTPVQFSTQHQVSLPLRTAKLYEKHTTSLRVRHKLLLLLMVSMLLN